MCIEQAVDNSTGSCWNIVLNRNINDWEIEELDNLMVILESIRIVIKDDKLIWSLDKVAFLAPNLSITTLLAITAGSNRFFQQK